MSTGEQLLASIPVFESLTPEELRVLAGKLEEHSVSAGEVIFKQGDEGARLYLIAEGGVDIMYGEGPAKVTLARLFTGQYFGELSVFDRAPRSATAFATKQTHMMTLDAEDVRDFVNRNPAAALRIIGEMSERLRQTNELMSQQVSRNVLAEEEESLTFGQRIADKVASFGGSWPFIFIAAIVMVAWMGINIVPSARFDPYPYILLNLALSSVAALQAPIIMMSQNRQSSKDKLLAQNDYQVNLKAETEIGALLRMQTELLARLAYLERTLLKKVPSNEQIEAAKAQLGLVSPRPPD